MTTLRELVDEVLLVLEGYGLNQGRAAFLSGPINETDASFVVDSTTNVEQGVAEIGDELVYVQAIDDAAKTVHLSPDGRGYQGSVAASHSLNSRLTMNPVFPRALVARKINETLQGTYPTLQAEASTELSASPVVYGYELPAEVEDITSIYFDVVGPSQAWLQARHFRLNRHADPDMFSTGTSLMLWDAVEPGRTIRVTYRKQPSELTDLADELTESGLAESAKAAIIWGTAWRLVSYMDISRLPVTSAQSDLVDEQNPIGRASDIARLLRAYYDQELNDEQKRQQLRTPPTVHYQDF